MDNNIERKIKQEYIDYCNEMQKGYLEKRIDEIFGRFHYKVKTNLHRFKKKIINLVKNKKEVNMSNKKVGRISAVFMAGTLALLGSTTAGESNRNSTEVVNNKIEYVDTNKGENNFKKSLYVQALEETITPSTVDETTIKSKSAYVLKANTKYTENSLGKGATGYVTKDTEVNIYNRALVKTDEQGNKNILYVTDVGQTWEEYAKEQGINYNKFRAYIYNNKSIQDMVSLEDGKGNQLGWVSISELKGVEEKER